MLFSRERGKVMAYRNLDLRGLFASEIGAMLPSVPMNVIDLHREGGIIPSKSGRMFNESDESKAQRAFKLEVSANDNDSGMNDNDVLCYG
jgi:hypothetical protein